MNLMIPTVRLQRDRCLETERMTKRMRRQARLAKSVRLPRDAWLPIFANAVFRYRLSTLANLLLYQILNEAVQSITILAGERREVWIFDRPINDLAVRGGLTADKSHDRTFLAECMQQLVSFGLIRRLESRKGRPVVYEVLLPPSEDGL